MMHGNLNVPVNELADLVIEHGLHTDRDQAAHRIEIWRRYRHSYNDADFTSYAQDAQTFDRSMRNYRYGLDSAIRRTSDFSSELDLVTDLVTEGIPEDQMLDEVYHFCPQTLIQGRDINKYFKQVENLAYAPMWFDELVKNNPDLPPEEFSALIRSELAKGKPYMPADEFQARSLSSMHTWANRAPTIVAKAVRAWRHAREIGGFEVDEKDSVLQNTRVYKMSLEAKQMTLKVI